MWTRCYSMIIWIFLIQTNEAQKSIFSQETITSSPGMTNFDCSEKPDGYYTLKDQDCLVYHTCETISLLARKTSTVMCPIGTKFNTRSKSCDSWHQVQCDEDAHVSFGEERLRKRRNVPSNDIPMDCFWCCKPADSSVTKPIVIRPTDRPTNFARPTERPTNTRPTHRPWWQSTSATSQRPANYWPTARPTYRPIERPTYRPMVRPTERPSNSWWYPVPTTTTATTTTTQYWWYPTSTTTTERPNYRPEIIEAKDNEIQESFLSPAYDVVFKFKPVKLHNHEKPNDDFVIIEDNYRPEIISARV